MEKAEIGIIGGSGLYEMEGLTDKIRVVIKTPFGQPSDAFVLGRLNGRSVAFLARHGKGHRILPGEINFRANIWGMKKLGVTRIIAVSAVGSMKEDHHPGDVVFPDQFFDHTKNRKSTFFGEGVVAHISFADPVCPDLRQTLLKSARECGSNVYDGGVYICIEGPQFSSRGESLIYRRWGVDVIGMTNATEAKLAREAEICYSTMALVTDYDCWHQSMEAVSVEAVLEVLQKNIALSKKIIQNAIPLVSENRTCFCESALRNSVITSMNAIPGKTRKKLDLLLGKYLVSPRQKTRPGRRRSAS